MLAMLESEIEKALKIECKLLGLVLIKLHGFNQIGIPDRLLLARGGRVLFLELKRPKGVTAKRQLYWQKKLRQLGFTSEITYTTEAAIVQARAHAARAGAGS